MFLYSLLYSELSGSHPDADKKSGLTYMRFSPELQLAKLPYLSLANYTEHYTQFGYIHPGGNKPKSDYNTIILAGTYLSNETMNVTFRLISQPKGAALLFDGKFIINNATLPTKICENPSAESEAFSEIQTIYKNRYHQITIFHNAGCFNDFRKVELTVKFPNSTRYVNLPTESIFTFLTSECAENYYGPTCSGDCTFSNCSNNGRCLDGQSGDGKCDCISGWIGPTCSDICHAEIQCHNHGRCLGNGQCMCHTGWSGSDCLTPVDANIQSRMIVGIVFYSACGLCFLISFIFQLCKMENSNPLTHILLFVFLALKVGSAVFVFINKKYTDISDMLFLLPTAILAFCLLRSISLIKNQFMSTSPHFKYLLLSYSLYIIPLLILIISILCPLMWQKLLLYTVAIPFGILSLFVLIFSVITMFIGMSGPFEKMEDLFPHLAYELRSSRRYVMCASIFYLVDAVLSWYAIDGPDHNFIVIDFTYYALIYVDIFTITCIGLANSAALSDIFSVKGDDIQFIPAGIASVTDLEENETMSAFSVTDGSDLSSRPLYSVAPGVYKDAENKFKRGGLCRKCLKLLALFIIIPIAIVVVFLVVVHPSNPQWSLVSVLYDNSQFFNDTISFLPNITIKNKMKVSMNITSVALTLQSKNLTIGSTNTVSHLINQGGSTHIFEPIKVSKATSFLNNIKAGDGRFVLTTICEAYPTALGFIKMHSKVKCSETLQMFPTFKNLDTNQRCEVVISKMSLK